MTRIRSLCRPLLLVMALPTAGFAEVVDRSASGFTVKTVVTIKASPDGAYRALVDELGRWWDPSHTWSGKAENLKIAATPGGCFCEALPNGGGVVHATVNYVVPGELIRMAGALGPLQEHAVHGALTWEFAKASEGTTVTMTYRAGGYFPGGLDKIADGVDAVLSGQVTRLKDHLE